MVNNFFIKFVFLLNSRRSCWLYYILQLLYLMIFDFNIEFWTIVISHYQINRSQNYVSFLQKDYCFWDMRSSLLIANPRIINNCSCLEFLNISNQIWSLPYNVILNFYCKVPLENRMVIEIYNLFYYFKSFLW